MATRREFLAIGAGAFALAGLPGVAFADVPGDHRFVLVLLRGALDGLAAVPPLGDPHYAERRGAVALMSSSCIALDHGFALNPGLKALAPYYQRRELLIVPASGNGYTTRSHFDAQDLMECGLSAKTHSSDGWLSRALALVQKPGDRRLGLAVGGAVPLVLRGPMQVASWEPTGFHLTNSDFLTTLSALYTRDPLLGPALNLGIRTQNFSDAVLGDNRPKAVGFGPKAFAPLAQAAGKLLGAADGPRIAALDMYGWDTHVNQGTETGRLYENLAGLAEGLDAMARALGPVWKDTVVVTVTEFGRTVAVNGTAGTDHGTASVMFILGGAVKGGRLYGDWPELARLKDNRDLRVGTDSRAVLKGILRDHFDIDAAALAGKVFPDAPDLRPAAGLLRA